MFGELLVQLSDDLMQQVLVYTDIHVDVDTYMYM